MKLPFLVACMCASALEGMLSLRLKPDMRSTVGCNVHAVKSSYPPVSY